MAASSAREGRRVRGSRAASGRRRARRLAGVQQLHPHRVFAVVFAALFSRRVGCACAGFADERGEEHGKQLTRALENAHNKSRNCSAAVEAERRGARSHIEWSCKAERDLALLIVITAGQCASVSVDQLVDRRVRALAGTMTRAAADLPLRSSPPPSATLTDPPGGWPRLARVGRVEGERNA